MISVQTVVDGLLSQGYIELGGSDVFRILRGINRDCVKVYYNDYDVKDFIVVRESVEEYNE